MNVILLTSPMRGRGYSTHSVCVCVCVCVCVWRLWVKRFSKTFGGSSAASSTTNYRNGFRNHNSSLEGAIIIQS